MFGSDTRDAAARIRQLLAREEGQKDKNRLQQAMVQQLKASGWRPVSTTYPAQGTTLEDAARAIQAGLDMEDQFQAEARQRLNAGSYDVATGGGTRGRENGAVPAQSPANETGAQQPDASPPTASIAADRGDYLVFDGRNVTHYNGSGEVLGSYSATSGQNGVTDPSAEDYGPIPPGAYTLNPSEISEGGFLRRLMGDWGRYRVPLHPSSSTRTYGRSGFFLHGGENPGSKGCIDIGGADETLFPLLMEEGGSIPVFVTRPAGPR